MPRKICCIECKYFNNAVGIEIWCSYFEQCFGEVVIDGTAIGIGESRYYNFLTFIAHKDWDVKNDYCSKFVPK